MVINTNNMALNAHKQLKNNSIAINKSSRRLSSGLKLTSAADDAAGLSISEKMRAQIRGLEKASQNIEEGISLFKTGDAVLGEVSDMIGRMKELAVQAANDTNTDEDREKLEAELSQILKLVDAIANGTEFNVNKILKPNMTVNSVDNVQDVNSLLNGVVSGWSLDSSNAQSAAASITSTPSQTGGDGFTFIGNDGVQRNYIFKLHQYLNPGFADFVKDTYSSGGIPVSSGNKIQILNGLVNALNQGLRASASQFPGVPVPEVIGAITNDGRIVLATDTGEIFKNVHCPAQAGTGGDLDGFLHTFLHGGLNFYSEAGAIQIGKDDLGFIAGSGVEEKRGLWIQMGANSGQGEMFKWNTLSVSDMRLQNAKLNPRDEALKTLEKVDFALNYVSEIRSQFGVYTNRLECAERDALNATENMSAAESRIRDADMAKEMMQYIKHTILTEASTAMLSQANRTPQTVLQLLQ